MINKQLITAVAFLHKDGKLFTAKRASTKNFLPNKFELPGGHIEIGETLQEGLMREFQEEFGVQVIVGEVFHAFVYENDVKQSQSVEIIFFATLLDINQKIILDPEQHSEYAWIEEEKLPQYFDSEDEEYSAIVKGFAKLKRT